MKGKHIKFCVLLLALIAVACFSLACQNGGGHSHVYSSQYSHDREYHWFECECGEDKDKEYHSFTDGVCKCGYQEVSGEHKHTYSETYNFNENFHWFECECGEKKAMAQHSFTDGVCECGYKNNGEHTHAYPETYSFNENFHWFECECGEKKSTTQHTFTDGKCVCGYEQKAEHVHSYITSFDDIKHWKECFCGDKKELKQHEFTDGKCECGYEDSKTSDHMHSYIKQNYNAVSHWYECVCGARYGEVAHSGGSATCSKKAVCDECEQEYGELKEHQYTLRFDDDYHWDECEFGEIINKEAHYGGEATFTERAICDKCEQPYGNYKERTTINIMTSYSGFGNSFYKEMIAKFETVYADKGWKVNRLPSSGSFGTATALAEMRLGAKGSGYDLVFPGSVYAQDVVDWKNEGFGVCAEDITDTVYKQKPIKFDGTEEDITIEDKLIPDEFSTWTAKHPTTGRWYGFLSNENVRGLVCNTRVLEQYAGISTDEFEEKYPRTTDELFAIYDTIMENEDAKNCGVRPVVYGGENAATYSVSTAWRALGQIMGAEAYEYNWSGQLYKDNGNKYYADDWKHYYENDALVPALEVVIQSWDDLYSVQGADAMTHDVAHGQLMLGVAAFMYDGNYFYEEVRGTYDDYLKDIRMIPAPAPSYAGMKLNLCGTNHGLGTVEAYNGQKCAECDKIFSEMLKLIYEGKNATGVKAGTLAKFQGKSITDEMIEKVFEIAGCDYGISEPGYIVAGVDPEVKEAAEHFLRMMASDDAAVLRAKYSQISAYKRVDPSLVDNSESEFLRDCFKIKSRASWTVDVHSKPTDTMPVSWFPGYSATIGVSIHADLPYNDKTYKDRDYYQIAKGLLSPGGKIYRNMSTYFLSGVQQKGWNTDEGKNPNRSYK